MYMAVQPTVIKSGKIPTLEFCVIGPMGHPHLFLSTFRIYAVRIREVQTFRKCFGSHPHHSGSIFPPRAFLGVRGKGGQPSGKINKVERKRMKQRLIQQFCKLLFTLQRPVKGKEIRQSLPCKTPQSGGTCTQIIIFSHLFIIEIFKHIQKQKEYYNGLTFFQSC